MEQAIYRELIMTGVDAKDSEDAIRQVGQLFLKNGFVKDTYIDAVVAREKVFATGLELNGISIAMPHTDIIHVNKPGVTVAKLSHPVEFEHMGEPGRKVQAEMLFMMAITNPEDQIGTIMRVLGAFQNKDAMEAFKKAETEDEIYAAAMQYIG
ncbi:MAG: PTS sugar transporter subunit IIA [Erysipelotrichaceae bacterium]|nr:PTS sugar transporter subunit IIA [Erysipelotrichaceae bacterium]